MSKLRILYVASEINPFLQTSEVANFVRALPQAMQEKGMEIRILVPRFGLINERKNRLHEVVRLSGINISVGDEEKPLIIKVASIPNAKLQVYFIDNEDYFKRKATLTDEEGNLFPDNDERAIFFAKGVIETVKKLNWSPDIIHVNGWLASMLPLYLRNYYGNEPLFNQAKIVTAVYNQDFDGTLDKDMYKKVLFDGLEDEQVKHLENPNYVNLMKTSVENSDAAIIAGDNIPEELQKFLDEWDKPVLGYRNREEFGQAYQEFYTTKVLS